MFITISAVCFFLFLLALYESFNLSSTKKTYKRIYQIEKLYSKDSLIDKINDFLESVARRFSKTMSKEEKIEIIEKLKRAGLNISYEKYVVEKVLYPIIIFSTLYLSSFIFTVLIKGKAALFIGGMMKPAAIILAFVAFFDMDKKVERSLQELRTGIIVEMPNFLATYRYSPEKKPFIDIAKDYIKNAGYLRYDLSLLIIDIDQFGTEKALKLFSQRVDILEVSEAVAIFINDLSGSREDSKLNLQILENKFLEIVQHKMEDSLKERPFYLESLNVIAILSITTMFLMVMAYQAMEAFFKLR